MSLIDNEKHSLMQESNTVQEILDIETLIIGRQNRISKMTNGNACSTRR